jgi:hypothetical protein
MICCDTCPYMVTCEEIDELAAEEAWGEEYEHASGND